MDEARAMVQELQTALICADPITSSQPAENEPLPLLIDPRWALFLQPSTPLLPQGHLLALRDVGLGWRAFLLPSASAAELAAALTRQLGVLAASTPQPPRDQAVCAANDSPVLKH